MKAFSPFLFLLPLFFLPLAQTAAQQPVTIDSTRGTATHFRLTDLDHLYGLDGDTVSSHPYWTFLWIFGDGSFINGTRDSALAHVYQKRDNQNYHRNGLNSAADVTVHATGNYSGGTRPPRMPAPPTPPFGNPFRGATVQKDNFKLAALGNVQVVTTPLDTSVIDTTKTGFLRLQLSKDVRPQDTLVGILSFRQPGKVPLQHVGGQLFLFYNSKLKSQGTVVPAAARGQFKGSPPPPPPPPLTHGKTDFLRSLIHFTNISDQGTRDLGGLGADDFQNVVVFDFDSLAAEGRDERHLFLEMENDSILWDLFKDGQEDELKFLAVMTVSDTSQGVMGDLPNLQLPDTGMQGLLTSTRFSDGTFIQLDQDDPQPQIVGFSEVTTPVVSAYDPNSLQLFACECPNTAQRKVVGVIAFSNDGSAPTNRLSVTLKIPDQLNFNSLQTISMTTGLEATTIAPVIDEVNRTATWTWPGLLQPAASAGFGHQTTKGQIVFSLNLKDSTGLASLAPMDACIVFNLNTPMCTLPVGPGDVITSFTGDPAAAFLQCVKCEVFPDEGEVIICPWWCCWWWWALGILLLAVVVWLVRRQA